MQHNAVTSQENKTAIASFNAKIPEDKNREQSAWCFNMRRQIYHYIEPLPSQTNRAPVRNSYYILDGEDAIERQTTFVYKQLKVLLRRINS